jgi:hypothetical protein
MLLKKSPQKICRIGKRNNRIVGTSLLNRSCVFDAHLESILLGVPPQNPFSTASVKSGKAQIERKFSGLPPAEARRASED